MLNDSYEARVNDNVGKYFLVREAFKFASRATPLTHIRSAH